MYAGIRYCARSARKNDDVCCVRSSEGRALGFAYPDGSFRSIHTPLSADLDRAFVALGSNRRERIETLRYVRTSGDLEYRFGRKPV